MDKDTQKNLLKIVQDNYEEIAGGFSETRKNLNWPFLAAAAGDIKEGSRILDIGCGNGRLVEIVAEKKTDYLGVDISAELLRIAKERFPEKEFMLGDILDLGQVPGLNYNYVFCVAVLHHIPGRDLRINALKQLKNKVSADGRIIITVWNMWPQKKFLKLILKFAVLKIIGKNKMDFSDIIFDWGGGQSQNPSKRYYHAFTKLELRGILKKAGLKIEKLTKDKFNYYIIAHK